MSKLLVSASLAMILASTAAGAASPPKAAPKGTSAPSERTYCFKFEGGTGTRISTTECRTKSEWRRLGVDVDHPSNN